MSRWAFLHNLSLHLTSSIQVKSDGLYFSDNMTHLSEKWLVKALGFFLIEPVAFTKQCVELISQPEQLMYGDVTPDYAGSPFSSTRLLVWQVFWGTGQKRC